MKILDHYNKYKDVMDRTSLLAILAELRDKVNGDYETIQKLKLALPYDDSFQTVINEFDEAVRIRDEIQARLNK